MLRRACGCNAATYIELGHFCQLVLRLHRLLLKQALLPDQMLRIHSEGGGEAGESAVLMPPCPAVLTGGTCAAAAARDALPQARQGAPCSGLTRPGAPGRGEEEEGGLERVGENMPHTHHSPAAAVRQAQHLTMIS